jgi:hypothetical protein
VRGVCDEPPLRVKGHLQTCQQSVDRVGKLAQFVARAGHREALVEIGVGDPIRRGGDRPQRRQNRPATSHPSATETIAMIASAIPE